MKNLRRKLTYANVVATLALFIAIGGASAFAASQLGKNTVGPKQLKKNSVTAAKIKAGAVTSAKIGGTLSGTQINASTLGTVPSASSAENAQSLDGQSAAQLTSSSKLGCPAGMALYDGVCFEEAPKSAKSWLPAAEKCWTEHLRLPTLGELMGFESATFTKTPPPEWTEPEWFTGSESRAFAVSATGSKFEWGSTTTNEKFPYRCVTLASN